MRSLDLICLLALAGAAYGIANLPPISTLPSTLPPVKCGAAPSPLFQGLNPPFPTDAWWTGAAVLPSTEQLAGPFPYISSVQFQGLDWGFPRTRTFDGTSIHTPAIIDLSVYAAEIPNTINNHRALHWDEMTLTVQWFNGASTLTSYLVPGAAYMTFEYKQATVNILARQSLFATFGGKNVGTTPVTVQGDKFKFTNDKGGSYILYALTPISLSVTSTAIVTASQYSGVIRIAYLNTTAVGAEAALDASSKTYATSAQIWFDVKGDNANLYFNWTVVGNPAQLLHLAYIHQRQLLQNPTYVTAITYLTQKGFQVGVLGNAWAQQYALPTISFFAPRAVDASCVQILNEALDTDTQNIKPPVPNDFYYWGGSISAIARLALIAEELGRKDVIPKVVAALQTSFDPWFNHSNNDPAAYETGWGGIVSQQGATNPGQDFGNGYYNDHHFHYGYHLFAAAVISRYDPAWFKANERYITALARDIGNPSPLDPHFPVTRHRDWFAGHSWASGIANGAGARDEESTTEAINGYYGLYLYALTTSNCDLQNFARLLLATEIHGVRNYWHLYPNTNVETAYPEAVFRAFTTVGNVQDQQAGPWLWWGAQRLEISGIQMLPYTAITEYVIDLDWAKGAYTYASVEFADKNVGDDWKNLMYMAHAVWDSVAAFQQAVAVSTWGSGNTYTNSLWWIATRASQTGTTCNNAPVNGPPIVAGLLFSKSANAYVQVGAGSDAFATATTVQQATVFNFSSISGGSTIQSVSTLKYASSDNTGAAAMVVNRDAPSAWETYVFTQVGNFYTIRALSNSEYIGVSKTGTLVNSLAYASASQVPDAGLFRFVCPGGATTCATPPKKHYTYTPQPTINTPPLSPGCTR